MSKFNPENDFSEGDIRGAFEKLVGIETWSLASALEELDTARNDTMTTIALRLHEIRQPKQLPETEPINIKPEIDAMYKIADVVLRDDLDIDAKIDILANILTLADSERVAFFQQTTESDEGAFVRITQESAQRMVRDIVTESEDVAEKIASAYFSLLEIDMKQLHSICAEIRRAVERQMPDELNKVGTLEIKKNNKEHIIDVAKIAAGIVVAVKALRWLEGK